LTFKEDVPDLRNTKVVDIIRELEDYGVNVRVHDPLADSREAMRALLHPAYPLLLDVKGAFQPEEAEAHGIHYWRL
jgi:UDP-N-acetyl-D-galactosamine dehydrogenase